MMCCTSSLTSFFVTPRHILNPLMWRSACASTRGCLWCFRGIIIPLGCLQKSQARDTTRNETHNGLHVCVHSAWEVERPTPKNTGNQNPRIPFTREGASQNQRSTFADSFYTSLNYPYEKLSPKPQDFGGHVGLHCTSRNYKAHREIF